MLILRHFGRLISSRTYATIKVSTACKGLFNGINSDLDRALIDAQEIVHYSMLVLNETRNDVTDQLKEVYGGHHPLLDATEKAYDNNTNIKMRELLLLLMSSITQQYKNQVDEEISQDEVLQKQLTLTEIIELIYKTNLLHQSIDNHKVGESRLSKEDWDIHYNNKLAILFGDFYVARAWAALGRLRNNQVNQLMAQGIADFTEGQFIMHTETHITVDNPEKGVDWENRQYLMNASLPGHACQSISAVAGLNRSLQEQAFKLGKNFSLCWQALNEMEPFLQSFHHSHPRHHPHQPQEISIDLMSLPVLLQMKGSDELYRKVFFGPKSDPKTIDLQELYSSIINGQNLEETRQVKNNYADEALEAISQLSKCDASCALVNILVAIKET